MAIHPRRRRVTAVPAGAALAAVALLGTALTGTVFSDAAHAAITGPIDCPIPLPTTDAVKGLTGTGYTVSEGTEPDAFTATVLGRIKDGIGPGVDMIMAELDSPALDAAGGVWAGMSGSPVYTADGHLIGAVSYGLAASSPIAGITPASTMTPLLTGGNPTAGQSLTQHIKVSGSQAKALSSTSGLGLSTTSRGFSPLALPLGVSGTPTKAGQKVLNRFSKKLGNVATYHGASRGVKALNGSAVDDVHAGGNFAGVLSYGDASFYGVGTTTFVCGGRAVAFGHPFDYTGETKMGANLADVVYVQPDATWGPFKVANITDTVGTVNRDSLTGIAATLGTAPAGQVAVTTKLTNNKGKTYTGGSSVAADQYSSDIAAYTLVYNIERALGASGKGSATLTFTIKGKRANGTPFTVTHKDKVVDRSYLSYAAADMLYMLGDAVLNQDFEKVTLTSIDVTGTVSPTVTGYRASKLEVYRNGKWNKASKGPFKVKSKGTITSRVTLTPLGGGTSKHVGVKLTLPKLPKGRYGQLNFTTGSDPWSWDLSASSFTGLLAKLNNATVSNGIYVTSTFPGETKALKSKASKLAGRAIQEFGDSADLVSR